MHTAGVVKISGRDQEEAGEEVRIDEDAIEKHLATELEGGLFVEIFLLSIFGKSWGLQKVYYTVEKGVVYEVCNGNKYPTGDKLLEVSSTCRRIGDYDPEMRYEMEIRDFSYAQINRLFTHSPKNRLKNHNI